MSFCFLFFVVFFFFLFFVFCFFFFSSRRRHTRSLCDWSSDVCSSDLRPMPAAATRSGVSPVMSRPRNRTCPPAGRTRPITESSVVVLPAPLGPRTPTISPTPTSSDTPLTAATLPYRASSPSTLSTRALPAEVGLDHARVGLDLGGRSLGDLLAEVQHGDPVGDAHHEIHRVLDEEDGLAQLAQAPAVLVEALELELAHARRRLVEEEAHRVGGQRAGHLEPPPLAEVQALHHLAPLGSDPGELEQRLHTLGLAARAVAAPRGVPEGHPHVVEDAHPREEADVLEGPRDPAPYDLMGLGASDRLVLEADRARRRGQRPG